MKEILFTLNGNQVAVPTNGHERLLDMLRTKCGAVEVKEGCGEGECGACTVLLDGLPITSCTMFAFQVHGRTVTTVKGVDARRLDAISEAMVGAGAVQCGFCTPGFVLTIYALLEDNPKPTRQGIQEALAGNLCRCTGYERIFVAVEALAGGAS
jgi:aerobic-type carbon monoxide dehydrogenase small subunit (CoxS/CutS family)